MAEDNEDDGENGNCDNRNKIKIESLKVMRTIGTGQLKGGANLEFGEKFGQLVSLCRHILLLFEFLMLLYICAEHILTDRYKQC